MPFRTIGCAGFLLALSPHALSSQARQPEPPITRLSGPSAVGAETFSTLRGLIALADGQLMVSDTREQKVMLIDPTSGNARLIGRVGRGPGEYSSPGGVYLVAGGGGRVYDPSQQRFVTFGSDGRSRETSPVPSPSSSTNFADSGPDQWVPDTVGNVYTAFRNPLRGGGDSVMLVRTRAEGRSDTIARLGRQESKLVSASGGVRMSRIVLFSPADVWAVAPDGWVAVVRPRPYHVEWTPPGGQTVMGPPVSFTALKVTEEDKQAARERLAGSQIGSIAVSGSGGAERRAVGVPSDGLEFKDVKPPFPVHLPRIDAAGRVWVRRSGRAGETTQVYDVFDRQGNLVRRYQLPPRHDLVGFDREGGVFAVQSDEDDLLRLVRFSVP